MTTHIELKQKVEELLQTFDKKVQNVQERLNELQADRTRLYGELSEANATYQTVVTKVSMGEVGFSNKNILDSKRKLSELEREASDVEAVIETIEANKHTQLKQFIPALVDAVNAYKDAYNKEVIEVAHMEVRKAQVEYLASLYKLNQLQNVPKDVVGQVATAHYHAGVQDVKVKYVAPMLDLPKLKGSLIETDSYRIYDQDITDLYQFGYIQKFPRVQAFLEHNQLFDKVSDAQQFLKGAI